MLHIEFLHRDHFEYRYHRKKARKGLSKFIEFFWETDFEPLWETYPQGFSDVLFPSVGYTYLINLGTPFRMQLDDKVFPVKTDSFLPRYKNIACHHSTGNALFGIKFRVSPIVFEKKINFADYKEQLFPLAYLIDRTIVHAIKAAGSFQERISIVSDYYAELIRKYAGSLRYADIVTDILHEADEANKFSSSIEYFAEQHGISSRTLQRYFEAATGVGSKQALQLLRVRKAISSAINDPAAFDCTAFGYYDYSHFYKDISRFLKAHPVAGIKSHLDILNSNEAEVNY